MYFNDYCAAFTMLEWDDFLNRILVISHYSQPPRKILCPPSYLLLATPLNSRGVLNQWRYGEEDLHSNQ